MNKKTGSFYFKWRLKMNFNTTISAISAGARNEFYASTTACVLMLIVVISLVTIPVIASKLRNMN